MDNKKNSKFVIIDDPQNANGTITEEQINKANEWMKKIPSLSSTKEVYGAKIQKPPESTLSARIRSTNLKDKHRKEIPKPDRKYKINDLVSVPYQYFEFTNGRVVGHEWGGDHRDIRRDVWCYWVRPNYDSSEVKLVPEDEIGRITL